ncbi:MAG: thiol reductant ABC exporter subunit CydC [Peptococcaceae bacterium]|nr:thiol reductant ABC exporter subunit CydC [Peptococcaceae bacterium]
MVKTLRWLMAMLAPYRWQVFFGSVLVALTVLGNVGLLATSGLLLSKAALTPEVLLLMPLITGVRFFGIGRAVLRYAERLLNHSIAFRILGRLRRDFYDHLEPLVPDALPNYSKGKLYNQFMTDIEVLQYFYLKAVSIPLGSLFIYTACALFLAFFEPRLIPLLLVGQLVAGLVMPCLAVSGGRSDKQKAAEVQQALSEQFLEHKQGLTDLHLFGKIETMTQALQRKTAQLTVLHMRMSLKKKLLSRLTFALSHLTMLAALWLMLSTVQTQRLDGVYVAMLALLVLASFEAILQMPEAVLQMEESVQAAEEMRAVYEQPRVERPLTTAEPSSYTLTCEHLDFHYHQNGRHLIEDLNLAIPEGQHLAIVGESGSGKSSLARVLAGQWQIDGGSLLLGDVPLAALDDATLHRLIASVDQESYFFYTSIRENMQLANVQVTDEAIWQALAMVELETLVRAMQQGLDTVLAENAAALSGGERQRLAIARMIVQEPRIVILDEALQKLDKRMAERIFARLLAWGEGRTMIVISHSLSMVAGLDLSCVMSYGKIIEQGAHAALLKKENGSYRALYDIERSQF